MFPYYLLGKDLDDHKSKPYDVLELNTIYNPRTLNIFTDVSMTNMNRIGCYGALAICRDTIVEEIVQPFNGFTNIAGEAIAIRHALSLAYKYRFMFDTINIFSDSLINIDFIRNYRSLRTNPIYNNNKEIIGYKTYNISGRDVIANEGIVNECINLFVEANKVIPGIQKAQVKILYVPAHLYDVFKSTSKNRDLTDKFVNYIDPNLLNRYMKENHLTPPKYPKDVILAGAIRSFVDNNNLYDIPTSDYMIYICSFNEHIDNVTRMFIQTMLEREKESQLFVKRIPIKYLPQNAPKNFYRKELDNICFVDT